MKKLMQIGLLAVGLAGFGLPGRSAEQKIATVDFAKAFNSYYKTIQAGVSIRQEISDAKKEEAQMVESYKKHGEELSQLIDKANDQAVSAEQRDKSRRAADDKRAEIEVDKQSVSEFERRAEAHLRAKEDQRMADLVKEIQGVVSARAKTAGYSMVLDSSGLSRNNLVTVLLYSNGQDDLTESIIKELNAAAPPGSLDTNAPAASAPTNLLTTPTPQK
jgi:Skp family chaperone for outer membrane proteins